MRRRVPTLEVGAAVAAEHDHERHRSFIRGYGKSAGGRARRTQRRISVFGDGRGAEMCPRHLGAALRAHPRGAERELAGANGAARFDGDDAELGKGAWRLDSLLWPEGEVDQAAVRRSLVTFREAVVSLPASSLLDAHASVAENLDGLIAETEVAYAQASEDPPDYTMARALIGAYTQCHRTNDPRLGHTTEKTP